MDIATNPSRARQVSKLRQANLIACLFHGSLAVAGCVSLLDQGPVTATAFWQHAEWNSTKCGLTGYGSVPICPQQRLIGTREFATNFSVVLIVSQTVTTMFHFLQYLASTSSSLYTRWALIYGIKVFSWAEYTVTAAMTSHVLMYYSGMLDIRTQILGYAAQSTLMVIGLTQDLLRHCGLTKTLDDIACRWCVGILFVLGFYNLMSVWFPSLYNLWIDTPNGQAPPDFVKWVVLVEFMLYSSFGFAQLCFYAPYLWAGRHHGVGLLQEKFYLEDMVLIVLSFIAKVTLNSAFSVCLVYQQCGD